MSKDIGAMKVSVVILWLFVFVGFASAAYLFRKVEHLEARLVQCEGRDQQFRADISHVDSEVKSLGGSHNELVKYLNKKAELDKQQADTQTGLGLLGLLFGL
jgi:hypothetical protein